MLIIVTLGYCHLFVGLLVLDDYYDRCWYYIVFYCVFLLGLGSWVVCGAGKGKEKLTQPWVESLGGAVYICGRLTTTAKAFSEELGGLPCFCRLGRRDCKFETVITVLFWEQLVNVLISSAEQFVMKISISFLLVLYLNLLSTLRAHFWPKDSGSESNFRSTVHRNCSGVARALHTQWWRLQKNRRLKERLQIWAHGLEQTGSPLFLRLRKHAQARSSQG